MLDLKKLNSSDRMIIEAERAAVTSILKSISETDVYVMDLGAREGEDTEWMLELLNSINKTPHALMIEADWTNFQIMSSRGIKAASLLTAIAAHEGTCDFYECREHGGGFGSIYKPLGGLSASLDEFTKIGPIPCITFDEVFRASGFERIDLLWVDIHGAEKDMIQHGRKALAKTRYLFMEVFTKELYSGMATKDQLLAMLPGWIVMQEFPWNILLQNTQL